MSGAARIVSGQIAQSKAKGQELTKALDQLTKTQNVGANPSKVVAKKPKKK